MSLNFETVKTDLYDWAIANGGGSSVIFLNENSPRPATPYITLFLSSLVEVGDDYIPRPDGMGDVEMTGDREFTLQVQSYGGDPITTLENLRSSLQKTTVLDTLRADNIVFVNHNPINDVTALLDTEFESRASMDVLFRIAQNQNDNLGLIETVEVEQIYSDGESVVFDEITTITV